MGRRSQNILTDEEKKQKKQQYHRDYYNEFKSSTLSQTVIDNAIERLMRDDAYIQQLLNKVGHDKIYYMMYPEDV